MSTKRFSVILFMFGTFLMGCANRDTSSSGGEPSSDLTYQTIKVEWVSDGKKYYFKKDSSARQVIRVRTFPTFVEITVSSATGSPVIGVDALIIPLERLVILEGKRK